MNRVGVAWAALWIGTMLLAGAPLSAQSGASLRGELAQIRDATALHTEGDLAGAERRLREVLTGNPTSLSALLMLERVLTVQGRAADLLPLVEELLEREPSSALGHQLRVRTHATLDRAEELERTGSAWIAATPRLETPYRELARLWLARQDYQRALEVLELGRKRVGTRHALALELGDVHAAAGDMESAVREWDRAIGPDGQGFLLVQRRLDVRADGGSALTPALVQALSRDHASAARQRAALQLALDAGLGAEARQIAPELLASLPPSERESFLADVARRADGAGLARIGHWAYGELLKTAERGSERLLALRARHAQLALAVGDTAGAAAAYQQLELATVPGSPQRQQAVAVRIRLAAGEGDPMAAAAELRAFRAEYPDAPELDETAAAVGEALLTGGQLDAAEQAVLGVRGPRSALVRGRSFLRRGDTERATAELLLAAPALHGAEATRVIALAAVLTRVSGTTGELLGSTIGRLRDDAAGAIRDLIGAAARFPVPERAAVLDFAAARADEAGQTELAELARRTLLAGAPRSDVAPAALFWLAQRAGRSAESREEAVVLWERLIVDYPRSALVPQARRELDRIAGRVLSPASSKAGVS